MSRRPRQPSPPRRVGSDLVSAALGVKLAVELGHRTTGLHELTELLTAAAAAETLLTALPTEERP